MRPQQKLDTQTSSDLDGRRPTFNRTLKHHQHLWLDRLILDSKMRQCVQRPCPDELILRSSFFEGEGKHLGSNRLGPFHSRHHPAEMHSDCPVLKFHHCNQFVWVQN